MLKLWVWTLALHYTGACYSRVRSLVYILTGTSFSRLLLGWRIHFVSMWIGVSMVVRLRHSLEGLELVELLLSRVAIDSPFLLKISLGVLFASNWLLLLLLIIHELLHISNILMGLRRLCDSRLESCFLGIGSLNLLWRIRRLLGGCILLILVSNNQAHNLLVAQETLTWRRVVGAHISVMMVYSKGNVPLIWLSYCYCWSIYRSTDRAWSPRGKYGLLLNTLNLLALLWRRSVLFVHLINHFNLFVWNLAIIVS
jgi:hypothetical protein